MKTPECQPSLFELPEVPKDPTDFLTPKGKKRNSIPTGMKREEIINLKKNKGKRRTGNTNWPNEY